jgi:ribosome-binding protein aMBF1 (putative translation factor)
MSEDGSAKVSCQLCGETQRIMETVNINGSVFALCEKCSTENPTLARSTGATARILGANVSDVRGQLRD